MDLYKASGVDYDVLDAGKRAAVAAALSTSAFAEARGARSLDASRGEPAFVFELGDRYLSLVLECLGTKSTIARQHHEQNGVDRFAHIGYDSVAAIVNDIVCVGALPLVINAYFATGAPEWFAQGTRYESLVAGWKDACRDSGAVWGGGETPGLSGVVVDTEIDLAGCAVGATLPGRAPVFGEDLAPGDEIVLIASTGMHTNGASLVRKLVGDLPDGYATLLPSGVTFGDAVLTPSAIYVSLVEALLQAEIPLSYLSHLTGHGFRKLMRADRELTYRITSVPPVPEVLEFLVDRVGLDAEGAYGTFNMGAGFAVYCAPGSGERVVEIAKEVGHHAWVSGAVEVGARQVVIEPLGLVYSEEDLQLR